MMLIFMFLHLSGISKDKKISEIVNQSMSAYKLLESVSFTSRQTVTDYLDGIEVEVYRCSYRTIGKKDYQYQILFNGSGFLSKPDGGVQVYRCVQDTLFTISSNKSSYHFLNYRLKNTPFYHFKKGYQHREMLAWNILNRATLDSNFIDNHKIYTITLDREFDRIQYRIGASSMLVEMIIISSKDQSKNEYALIEREFIYHELNSDYYKSDSVYTVENLKSVSRNFYDLQKQINAYNKVKRKTYKAPLEFFFLDLQLDTI